MGTIKEGDSAPAVTLTGENGQAVELSALYGTRTLVVYFYPKDETAGCTAQACGFRDAYQDFTDAGADVIGISADSDASHDSFKKHHRLPFRLLSDPRGEAARAFGVTKTWGLIPGRVTFVIDRQGVVRQRFDSQLRIGDHVSTALTLVKSLEAAAQPAA